MRAHTTPGYLAIYLEYKTIVQNVLFFVNMVFTKRLIINDVRLLYPGVTWSSS